MATSTKPSTTDPDEKRDIRELISEVIPSANTWIETPNDLLGGRKPRDLIGTEQEERVRELTRAFRQGMFT